MIYPLAALALLWFFAVRTPFFSRLSVSRGAALYGKVGAVLVVLAALFALLHGNLWAALCLFGGALWLLGRAASERTAPDAPKASSSKPASGWSRSATLEVSVDRASGRLRGGVIAGPFAGAILDNLDRGQLAALRHACAIADPAGVRLLDVYLDGRFPGWREAGDAHGHAGQAGPGRAGGMTEEEAYQVLGLRRGETRDEIKRAHRTAMKRWHPDQGGSVALAARANEAKEVLLRRHARNS